MATEETKTTTGAPAGGGETTTPEPPAPPKPNVIWCGDEKHQAPPSVSCGGVYFELPSDAEQREGFYSKHGGVLVALHDGTDHFWKTYIPRESTPPASTATSAPVPAPAAPPAATPEAPADATDTTNDGADGTEPGAKDGE